MKAGILNPNANMAQNYISFLYLLFIFDILSFCIMDQPFNMFELTGAMVREILSEPGTPHKHEYEELLIIPAATGAFYRFPSGKDNGAGGDIRGTRPGP